MTTSIENRVEKQFLDTYQKSVSAAFSKRFFPEEAIHELNKIIELEQIEIILFVKHMIRKKDKKYDFQKFNTSR